MSVDFPYHAFHFICCLGSHLFLWMFVSSRPCNAHRYEASSTSGGTDAWPAAPGGTLPIGEEAPQVVVFVDAEALAPASRRQAAGGRLQLNIAVTTQGSSQGQPRAHVSTRASQAGGMTRKRSLMAADGAVVRALLLLSPANLLHQPPRSVCVPLYL